MWTLNTKSSVQTFKTLLQSPFHCHASMANTLFWDGFNPLVILFIMRYPLQVPDPLDYQLGTRWALERQVIFLPEQSDKNVADQSASLLPG